MNRFLILAFASAAFGLGTAGRADAQIVYGSSVPTAVTAVSSGYGYDNSGPAPYYSSLFGSTYDDTSKSNGYNAPAQVYLQSFTPIGPMYRLSPVRNYYPPSQFSSHPRVSPASLMYGDMSGNMGVMPYWMNPAFVGTPYRGMNPMWMRHR